LGFSRLLVAAERVHAAAANADVAEDDRRHRNRANALGAREVLRLAERVHRRRRIVGADVRA